MTTLYVTEADATVRIADGNLTVSARSGAERGLGRPSSLKLVPHRLDMVALVGRAHITSEATRYCLDRHIPVTWFRWNGEFLGKIVPPGGGSPGLRMRQYAIANDPERHLDYARRMVWAKLQNAAAVLARCPTPPSPEPPSSNRHHPHPAPRGRSRRDPVHGIPSRAGRRRDPGLF